MLSRALLARIAALIAACAFITACAINTDPILADGDAGPGLADAAPPAAEADLGAFIAGTPTDYDGCDVDWHCTDGCADDLDCDPAAEEDEGNADAGADAGPGPDAGPTPRPGPADTVAFAETAPDGAPHALAADAEIWLDLGAIDDPEHIAATVETGALTLAAYALPGGALLARSTDDPALRLSADPSHDAVLRVVAGPDGATFTLTRADLPTE